MLRTSPTLGLKRNPPEVFERRKTLNLQRPQAGCNTETRMRTSRGWFGIVRRKFHTPFRAEKNIHLHATIIEDAIVRQEITNSEYSNAAASPLISSPPRKKDFSKEDIAAIKIQAFFRAHLARRAFRALKSLVKLQALVRGVCVRRQSRIALHCMHALVRLQVRVRARQLLGD